jgi:NADH:ubiquinone oxidoreductase subunit K
MNEGQSILLLAALLFSIGLLIVFIKRNAIMILLGIELMFNSANLNLVAFNQSQPLLLDGQIFALFIIIVAVCEAAIGIAIILRAYQYYHSAIPDQISELKEKN